MNTISEYVESKQVKRSELLENFKVIKEFKTERCGLSFCGNCNDVPNTMRLPSEEWAAAIYYWRCESITMMYPADRMSGNSTDRYEVFGARK